MNWRPISTAPKDGTLILGYGPITWITWDNDHFEMNVLHFVEDEEYSHLSSWQLAFPSFEDFNPNRNPTHWMPLPEAPK
jgi:hypothetical protein